MGLLINGEWHDKWYDTDKSGGRFERQDAIFRHWITADGSAGPDGQDGFKAEADRYHLYVSHACPWAHRTIIFRQLKDLTDLIDVSVVDHYMGSEGWTFEGKDGATGDRLYGFKRAHEIYTKALPTYTGRVTVPILWDKKTETIVSNESSEIIRMFNSEFNHLTGNDDDYYPEPLRAGIDEINADIYDNINNGVYKSGFATTQSAYEEAVSALFAALDRVEARLENSRYLMGEKLTEADWRLFTTLLRFDPVYVGHFKCNIRRIADYPNLSNFTRELYQMPGIADTVNMHHIKHHYYGSHDTINPTGIVPTGPDLNLDAPHDRERLTSKGQARAA